jgi:acetyl-CoA carboxylase carboxyl transferase subunit alpha
MRESAEALRLTPKDLNEIGVCDRIIPEPHGGAHRDRAAAIKAVGEALNQILNELKDQSGGKLRKDRRSKYLALGSKVLAA